MDIHHDPTTQRFFLPLPGGEAELRYQEHNGILDILSTYTPPAARGMGVAAALVKAAVRYARERGDRVQPTCSYARQWFARHPEAQELLAPTAPS
jgi:predicted GNAT family acetyltransferase